MSILLHLIEQCPKLLNFQGLRVEVYRIILENIGANNEITLGKQK